MIIEFLQRIPGFGIPKLVIFDIGAMIEGEPRYASLLQHGCATVIGFEPQPLELQQLRAGAPASHKYFPYFLGKGGAAKFHKTRYPGCSSLYEPDPDTIDLFATIGCAHPEGNFHVEETSAVQTTRLDDIDGLPRADLVKLDVQGAGLDVLEGGADAVSRALVIEAETEFVPLYRGQALYGDIARFLGGKGFQFHKFVDVAGRTFAPISHAPNPYVPMSQILWADSIFVRDFARLPEYSNEDLVRAGIILDEVYRSFDLAAFLLLELDRRTGGNVGGGYVAALGNMTLNTMLLNIRSTP